MTLFMFITRRTIHTQSQPLSPEWWSNHDKKRMSQKKEEENKGKRRRERYDGGMHIYDPMFTRIITVVRV
jgi:hypothetical protein